MKPSTKTILCATLLSTMIYGSANAENDSVQKNAVEKCYGVAKAGKNDCAAKDGSNSCAGRSTKDSDPSQWVYVPKGLCDKLVGGTKEQPK